MNNITNIIKTSEPILSALFRASAGVALGGLLVFAMGLSLPNTAQAQGADFGFGDCYDCGGSDYYFPTTGGGSDYYFPTSGGGSDYYFPTTGGGSDYYFPTGGTDYYYPTSYGTDYYYPTYSYYDYPTYTSFPTYGGYTSYPTNYNNNQNQNQNINNNVITIGGGTSTTVHTCAETGQTGTYPNCHTPRTPTCADYGMSGSYPNCHGNQSQDVSCNLDASDTRVSDGDRVTLEWDTDGDVTYASINQGIGRVDEDGGSERVTVDGDTTFKMTVRNNSGDEDTCSVTVRVDDNNFSSVSFTGDPTYNPPVVYLSDIPYTGLEDIDPMLLSYWLMLIAAASAGVWFLYRRGMIPHFAFASVDPIDEGHVVEETEEGHADASPEVMSFLSALAAGDTDAAVDHLRDAAANGTGVEEFLADAETAATDAELQARVSAALEGAKQTGVKGAKEALA